MSEKKVLKHVYSILRSQAFVEVENKWIDYLDVMDEVEWNYIHYASLCQLQVHHWKINWGFFFIFNLFIRQSAPINFSIELVEPIIPIVIFVIIYQKRFCTYFVNVKKFPPFGMNYVFDQ